MTHPWSLVPHGFGDVLARFRVLSEREGRGG
jgi:hypothetical protein